MYLLPLCLDAKHV